MSRNHGRSFPAALGFVVLIVLATAPSSHASLVTLVGGLTSFSGDVGTGQFTTTFYEGDMQNGGEVTSKYVVCPTAGCNIDPPVGPASVTFASPVSVLGFGFTQFGTQHDANLIGFVPYPTPQDAQVGQEIVLGTLIFTNGMWFGDADFGLTVVIQSSDPSLDGHVFSDILRMRLTPNDFVNKTPEENADFMYFVNNTILGSLRAYELGDAPGACEVFVSPLVPGLTVCGNQVSAQLFGVIHSLDPTRFEIDPAFGGFFDPGVNLEPTPTPEPGTLGLLLLGVLSLVAVARGREPRL